MQFLDTAALIQCRVNEALLKKVYPLLRGYKGEVLSFTLRSFVLAGLILSLDLVEGFVRHQSFLGSF